MKHNNSLVLPNDFAGDDVRSSDGLVEFFIERYTKPGDVIFDPFAGFGTTIATAEKLGRVGYGVEYLADRVDYIRSIISNKENIYCGNSLVMEGIKMPEVDFSFSSPPYMSKNDHEEYPLAAYQITGDGYVQYLQDMKNVYDNKNITFKS
jgi:DNA modification methylase